MERNRHNDSEPGSALSGEPVSDNARGKPSLDGRRLRLADLQAQVTQPARSDGSKPQTHWLKRCWAACNDFLAGMYTGESCAGTPHSERHRSSPDTTDEDTAEQPHMHDSHDKP